MRTTQDYDVGANYPTRAAGGGPNVPGVGWVGFASVILGLAGLWNFFDGILAISSANVFVNGADYVFSDLKTWGWIVMILGLLQLFAAFALLNGSEWARWFGIAAAGLNAIGQLMYMPSYPGWAILMFSLDILIIYALTVYAGARLRTT